MHLFALFLEILGLVFFVLAAFGVPAGRVNFVGAGLSCWALAFLLPSSG